MAARRELTIDSLGRVMPEVDRLLEGHETVGRWSLGQICHHLAGAFIVSVEGTTFRAPWLLRMAVAPFALRRVLKTGRIAEGIKLPEQALPRPSLDARAEAEALRAALRLYEAHTGPMAAHPFFGPLDRDRWTRLHCIHCAHHLSFARPDAGRRGASARDALGQVHEGGLQVDLVLLEQRQLEALLDEAVGQEAVLV